MNSRTNETNNSLRKLLPHQSAFLETFFNKSSKKIILLKSVVGLGKSMALAALTSRMIHEQPSARILFLVPAIALRNHLKAILLDYGNPSTQIVDRYRFREMLDSKPTGNFWPLGMVEILTQDFARQPDIQDSLAMISWDLIIVDEAHLTRGERKRSLQKIGASAGRIILATISGIDLPDIFPAEDTTIIEWEIENVVGYDGKRLGARLMPFLHEIPFSLNEAELNINATIRDLSNTIIDITGIKQDFTAMVLRRSLESSPAALERALQKLLERFETQKTFLSELTETPEEEEFDGSLIRRLDRDTEEKAVGLVKRALQKIEAMGNDSKLNALGDLLSDLSKEKIPNRRICILTQYVGSLYYLSAEVEDRGMNCLFVHGGMSLEEHHRSLAQFSNEGKILVSTLASMSEGVYLPEVTDLILYDIPQNKIALQQILDRFNRFGRDSQLIVHIFRPDDISAVVSIGKIDLLRELMGVHNKTSP